jgi:hypothetical protein
MKGEGANSNLGTFGVCTNPPPMSVTYQLLQVKSGLAQMLKVKGTFAFNFDADGLRTPSGRRHNGRSQCGTGPLVFHHFHQV